MTDTDSSTPPNESNSHKHKKSRKKSSDDSHKKRKKHKRKHDDDSDSIKKKYKKKHKTKHKHPDDNNTHEKQDDKIVSSSAIEFYPPPLKSAYAQQTIDKTDSSSKPPTENNNITLLLFYQYVEPPWSETQFQTAFAFVTSRGKTHNLTGRMRVSREGLNCTLTGSHDGIRQWCADLRAFDGGRGKIVEGKKITEFSQTEFKLTDDLPSKQRFPKLHAFEVVELVNYGLAGGRAPEIGRYGGVHLEPEEYHRKMCEEDTGM
jgi:hypothetical protein